MSDPDFYFKYSEEDRKRAQEYWDIIRKIMKDRPLPPGTVIIGGTPDKMGGPDNFKKLYEDENND